MKNKALSFIIGGLIGFIVGMVQINAWGAPVDPIKEQAISYLADKKIEVPKEVEKACKKAEKKYGIKAELLEAIAWRESRYVQKAISKNGKCKGICQVNDYTHRERMRKLGVTDIYDIEGNVMVAADLLAELLEIDEDICLALDRYHGDRRADALYKRGEVSSYAESILKVSHSLELVNE